MNNERVRRELAIDVAVGGAILKNSKNTTRFTFALKWVSWVPKTGIIVISEGNLHNVNINFRVEHRETSAAQISLLQKIS